MNLKEKLKYFKFYNFRGGIKQNISYKEFNKQFESLIENDKMINDLILMLNNKIINLKNEDNSFKQKNINLDIYNKTLEDFGSITKWG